MRLRALLNWGFVLIPLLAGAAQAAQVQDIRVWAGPDHTRVVLDLTGPVRHSLRVLQNPDRVVVDLSNSSRFGGSHANLPGKGVIERVRTGVQNGRDLRVVIDLVHSAHPNVFLLQPNTEYGYRLVVDLDVPEVEPKALPSRNVTPAAPRQITAQPAKPTMLPAAPQAPSPIARAEPAPLPFELEPTAKESSKVKFMTKTSVVAIDAGHGGEDLGARGPGGTREKDVALAISRRLAKLINAEPGMKAVLVRDGDYYIGLRQRMIKARKNQADLFLSVHADANYNRSATGATVYVLSQRGASSEHARWLAEKENASDLIGGVRIRDKDDGLASFMLDLSQSAALEASFDLGARVLRGLGNVGSLHRRSVQQAGFMVLKSPDIPSLLVETAFISNRAEEKKLGSSDYQQKLAQAIHGGVKGYFATYRPADTVAANQ
ncbi:MAG: N-acetylmuramoyl-L-alanine amidase [Nevskiales bacterium]